MGISLSSTTLIAIYGGSGFIGRHVVRALAKTGARMRIAVRRPELAGFLQPLGGVGQIIPVQANVRYPDLLLAAANGADAVINLVGILSPSGKQTFKAVQDEGARHVAEAARAAGAKAFVHMSAIGADANSPSVYARTKAAGEAAVKEVIPDAVILRPSVVFGPEDEFFNRFAALARLSPALPLIGGGKTQFQPVFVGRRGQGGDRGADRQGASWRSVRARRTGDPLDERGDGARAHLHHAQANAGDRCPSRSPSCKARCSSSCRTRRSPSTRCAFWRKTMW